MLLLGDQLPCSAFGLCRRSFWLLRLGSKHFHAMISTWKGKLQSRSLMRLSTACKSSWRKTVCAGGSLAPSPEVGLLMSMWSAFLSGCSIRERRNPTHLCQKPAGSAFLLCGSGLPGVPAQESRVSYHSVGTSTRGTGQSFCFAGASLSKSS